MAEIKRGFPRDSFVALRESKQLGPYPCWDKWKSTLISFLGQDLPKDLEIHLHEWYILRRELQLKIHSGEEAEQKRKIFSDEHSSLFDEDLATKAFRFITEKTTEK